MVPSSGDADGVPSPLANRKLIESFEVFDHEQNQTVDRREVGAILRSLGFCPSEQELQEVLRDMEDPKHVGVVHLDRYLPVVTKLVAQQRWVRWMTSICRNGKRVQ